MSTTARGRREQRKAETRGALLSAARTLMAQRRTSVSIREITTLAGVGFGSFFNYFETKEALFEAAFDEAIAMYGALIDQTVAPIEDPAEAVSAGLRLTGRAQRRRPHLFRVLLSRGVLLMIHERGHAARFEARIVAGHEAGVFDAPDVRRSSLAVGGATMGLLVLLELDPAVDADAESDEFTRRSLMSLGVDADEAARLVALPLPAIPADFAD